MSVPVRTTPRYGLGDRVVINHGYGAQDITITISEIRAHHGSINAHRYWGTDEKGVPWGAYETQIVRKL